MRRFGDTDSFLGLIEGIRERQPEAGIRSNVIVGFPGETEEDVAELDRFADELEDRYGALPAAALALLATRRLALAARDLGVARIQVGPGGIAFTPRADVTLKPGDGQRESKDRIMADRRADVGPLDDALDALEAMVSAPAPRARKRAKAGA